MIWLRAILVFLAIGCSLTLVAQDKNEIIQSRIEFISEKLESESIDLTDIVAQLNYYFDHPINLNHADREELLQLGLLTEIQVNDLLLHRRMFGNLIAIYELQSLTYWDIETIQMVLPFVKVDDKLEQLHASPKEMLRNGKFEAFLRFQTIAEQKKGYDEVPDSILENSNSYYHGNADRYYSRLRFSYRTNLSIGFTAEKDPGEEFFNGSQSNGFDFYSAHAYYRGGKYLRSIAIGDYQVQIGQGLNLWSGYAFGKSADVTNVKRTARSLKPYTSVDETRFMRGGAIELGYKKIVLTGFASYKGVDGALSLDTLSGEEPFASSINTTGLHRTNSEIGRRKTLNESIFGSNLRFESRGLSIGVAAVQQGYDQPFIKDTLPYNQFDFRGSGTMTLSGDYNWIYRNLNFFGEVAFASHSKSFAQLHGALIALDKRAFLSVVYRNYDKGYHSFYNAGFAEGSKTQNERGIYTGLRINESRSLTLNAYVDLFKFPWLKYQVDAPSVGHEVMIQQAYKPSRSFEVYVRFREQQREKNARESDGTITLIEPVIQRNYRINLSYKVSESIRLKSRAEYVTIERPSAEPEDGFILTQDLIFNPKSFPLDLTLRYALFDTDSYDSRIYTYENNALYVFSVPAYYYQGSRAYALIRYNIRRKADLWIRYGRSIFSNRNSLGSSAEEIDGNTKTDITVQLRIKL